MDWLAEHSVELAGFVLTLAVTIIGWIMEHKSSKERDENRRHDISMLEQQVEALRDQASSLEEQTVLQRAQVEMATKAARVPKWRIYQVQNLEYAVENGNTFDARDVRVVLASGKEYELGDITKGSSIGFIFMEKGVWCEDGSSDIEITWIQPDDPERRQSVTNPSPRYVKS
ncbi:hypothetical protein [Bifidobacterium callimiconis]|nr:hypothetical protein [Bifidobacterium callimiconis]